MYYTVFKYPHAWSQYRILATVYTANFNTFKWTSERISQLTLKHQVKTTWQEILNKLMFYQIIRLQNTSKSMGQLSSRFQVEAVDLPKTGAKERCTLMDVVQNAKIRVIEENVRKWPPSIFQISTESQHIHVMDYFFSLFSPLDSSL